MAGENKSAGRPWKPIVAPNQHAAELAALLRRAVDDSGLTLAALAPRVSMSKSQIGVYLGGKIPTRAFVVAVVDTTVPPVLRERRRTEALALLHAANNPPQVPRQSRPSGAPVITAAELEVLRTQQVETLERLTRALEQKTDLQTAATNSQKLVHALLLMIYQLERRITVLTTERDELRHHRVEPRALADIQTRLERAEKQEQRAREELTRAETKQRQAEELAARVRAELDALTDTLDRLHNPEETAPEPALPARSGSEDEVRAVSPDPEGDDIEAALARVTAVNDADADALDRITTELDDVPGLVTVTVPVTLVPDNPPTSTVAPDNLTLDQLRKAIAEATRNDDAPAARDAFTQLVADRIRVLGADHLDVLASRHSLARWTGKAGDAAGAREAFAELAADAVRVLGRHHLDAFAPRHNLAYWTGKAGDAVGARDAFTELVADAFGMLGPDHPHTLASRHNLAYWTGKAGDAVGARDAFTALVADQTRLLGADHPGTLTSRHEQAGWTGESGDAAGARDMYVEVVEDFLRLLGPDHPDTLTARHQLALWSGEAGDPVGARDAFTALLAHTIRVLGPDHPNTSASRYERALWTSEAANS
ncbi:tetratricopeptide repeat protein [Streptomyces sp. NPDC051217]|uniref:tetratricopeptide repeat protein n=1 Tax=Streptomyces sp. NPDC051217 TaxID=3365644 RepID=UPI0037A8D52D